MGCAGERGIHGRVRADERLKGLEQLPIGANHGPETIAVDASGRLYTATREGNIVRLRADGSSPENWVSTGGRPLGLSFDARGTLFVADAFRGLLAISPDGAVRVLATEADGVPIRYANSVAAASDGKVYFSDASTKFGAKEWAGTYSASLLDILEHGGHGRLLAYDPASGRATTLIRGLNFANGVALAHDESFVLVAETGSYRVLRHWLAGPNRGRTEPLLEDGRVSLRRQPGDGDGRTGGQGCNGRSVRRIKQLRVLVRVSGRKQSMASPKQSIASRKQSMASRKQSMTSQKQSLASRKQSMTSQEAIDDFSGSNQWLLGSNQ